MQLAAIPRGQQGRPHFQYPRSDRAGCNQRAVQDREAQHKTFSILGRIERDATQSRAQRCRWASVFQYPRSDRAGCNKTGEGPPHPPDLAFSILGRIERDATPPGGHRTLGGRCLSVSSVGSSGMQLVSTFSTDY